MPAVPSTDAWAGVSTVMGRDFHTFHARTTPDALEVLVDMRAVVAVVAEETGCTLVMGNQAITVEEPYRHVLDILAAT